MKVLTNYELIASRQRVGRYAALAGLLVLMAGLFISFRWQNLEMVAVSYVALIVGMLLSSIGIYLADKWVQEPRADQALAQALKGFDDRYHLYNHVLPVEHVLVSPFGVTVFTVKRQADRVIYRNGRWKHQQSLFKRLQSLSRERLGDPVKQMEAEVQRMQEFLQQHLEDVEIPVDGVVVFVNPNVQLELEGAPAEVLHVRKLKAYLRRKSKQARRLEGETYRRLVEVLDQVAGQAD